MKEKINIENNWTWPAILNLFLVGIFLIIIVVMIKVTQSQTRIVTVDIKGIMQEFIVQSAATKLEGEELSKHIQEYTSKLESLTRELAEQENFIILPKNAVIAGGVDITAQVKELLQAEGGKDEKTN